MTLLAPSFCSLAAAIDTGLATARRLQHDVSVRWGAVTFELRTTDTPSQAFQRYLGAARVLIRLEDAAKGRTFGAHDPETGEIT